MSEKEWEEINLYKFGTAEYYKDVLSLIYVIGRDYDGYNPKSAKQMKELVDELVKMVIDALTGEKMYVREKRKKT